MLPRPPPGVSSRYAFTLSSVEGVSGTAGVPNGSPGATGSGPDGRVVIIDGGLVADIPDDLHRPFIETFHALALKDGKAAARLFYVYAPTVGTKDYGVYEKEVADYFDTFYGWAEHLITEGKAYVDDLSPEEMREYRGTLTETLARKS